MDVICLGDANLCAVKWQDENFQDKDLTEIGPGGMVSRSCIDHCYTNVPEKVSTPEVISVGTSDHLGLGD